MDDTTQDVSKRSLYFRATLLSHNSYRFTQNRRHAAPSRLASSFVKWPSKVIHTPNALKPSSRARRVINLSDTVIKQIVREEQKTQISASKRQSLFLVLAHLAQPCGRLVQSCSEKIRRAKIAVWHRSCATNSRSPNTVELHNRLGVSVLSGPGGNQHLRDSIANVASMIPWCEA